MGTTFGAEPPVSRFDPTESFAPVRLHLYALGQRGVGRALNHLLDIWDAGVFHCGVEVFGDEWSYGASGPSTARAQSHSPSKARLSSPTLYGDPPPGTGVYRLKPMSSMQHQHMETVDMGRTLKKKGLVMRHVRAMRHEWLADEYDVLEHNCCHFCVELCRRLGVGLPPDKVLVVPAVGKALRDVFCCKHEYLGEVEDSGCPGDCVMVGATLEKTVAQVIIDITA